MPPPIASHRIKEIVDLTRGNRSQAERMIREAIARDPQFLRQLVEPYLPGIIAHALERATPATTGTKPISAAPLPEGGMDALLRGLEEKVAGPRIPLAGANVNNHADTIRALAAAQRSRRDKS